MNDWRDIILKEFSPKIAKLTLVADPDGLLLEEEVLEKIREKGFELIQFDNFVSFRYSYESKYRFRWDKGEQTDLVVVLRSVQNDLNSLPYDLLLAGRKLTFSLGDIFPNLSYAVLESLDKAYLDPLFKAQKSHSPGNLGDNDSKEFVLRHVFEIASEMIKKDSDLLQVLLRRHYRKQKIPKSLDERFVELLEKDGAFSGWPLEILVSDREAFFAFLQERWAIYLAHTANKTENKDKKLVYPGPRNLPFGHDDIRVYIDNLFLEGLLEPVSYELDELDTSKWYSVGIQIDRENDHENRISRLKERLKIPKEEARHEDWLLFSKAWSEFIALYYDSDTRVTDSLEKQFNDFKKEIDKQFISWMKRRYASLVNLPPVPPVMLHHIPKYLLRNMKKNSKVALIVLDGLSLDQWIIIRKVILKQNRDFKFRENAVFAWIPTITSVSRQAIFAGNPPLYFPDSIQSTDKEAKLWGKFWSDQGYRNQEIQYQKGLRDGRLEIVEKILDNSKIRILGLVVDQVDRIMHGMQLGTSGMHNQVRQWMKDGFIVKLFNTLFERGFEVFITSDHGNIEASGCGRISEGAIAENRGERVRVYSDYQLRKNINRDYPETWEWQTIGLPEEYLPLLAKGMSAFVKSGDRVVCHGGVSIEEVVVPFVQIERRDND